MKYIKYFRESFTDYKNEELEFFKDVEDILLPIEDEDFSVQINKNEDSSDELMESEGELIRIYVEKSINDLETESYRTSDIFIQTFNQLLSFSQEKGYDCSMELVGENGGTISENECIAYSEFSEDDMTIEELLDLKAPINYIRFIIYKPE